MKKILFYVPVLILMTLVGACSNSPTEPQPLKFNSGSQPPPPNSIAVEFRVTTTNMVLIGSVDIYYYDENFEKVSINNYSSESWSQTVYFPPGSSMILILSADSNSFFADSSQYEIFGEIYVNGILLQSETSGSSKSIYLNEFYTP